MTDAASLTSATIRKLKLQVKLSSMELDEDCLDRLASSTTTELRSNDIKLMKPPFLTFCFFFLQEFAAIKLACIVKGAWGVHTISLTGNGLSGNVEDLSANHSFVPYNRREHTRLIAFLSCREKYDNYRVIGCIQQTITSQSKRIPTPDLGLF